MSIILKTLRSFIPRKDVIQPVVLILTLLWAVYTFSWKEYISGWLSPPKLMIETSLQPIKRTKDHQLVRINVTARNIGDQNLNILNDLWQIREINQKLTSRNEKDSDFDDRFSAFLKSGLDTDDFERVRTVSIGSIQAAGSLGWRSLKPAEVQRITDVIALPLASKEIMFIVFMPYAKNLHRESDAWINWIYHKKSLRVLPEICVPKKGDIKTGWHCAETGSKEYLQLMDKNEIRLAYGESVYVL